MSDRGFVYIYQSPMDGITPTIESNKRNERRRRKKNKPTASLNTNDNAETEPPVLPPAVLITLDDLEQNLRKVALPEADVSNSTTLVKIKQVPNSAKVGKESRGSKSTKTTAVLSLASTTIASDNITRNATTSQLIESSAKKEIPLVAEKISSSKVRSRSDRPKPKTLEAAAVGGGGGRGEAGMLRIPAALRTSNGMTSTSTSNVIPAHNVVPSLPPPPARVPRPGVDIPPSRGRQATVGIEDMMMSKSEHEVMRVRQLETSIQHLIEKLRKDKLLLSDHVQSLLLGCSSDLHTQFKQMNSLYTSLGNSDPLLAFSHASISRRWALQQRYLECFIRVFNSSRDIECTIGITIQQLSQCFELECINCQLMLDSILPLLQEIHRTTPTTTPEYKDSLAVILQAKGDILRYQALYLNSDNEKQAKVDSVASFEHYKQALGLCPDHGSCYKSIAAIMKINGNNFLSMLYLLRSMCCTQSCDVRETLVKLFESEKATVDQLSQVNLLSGLTLDDHRYRLRVHFLACAGIAYTRVDADHFQYHLDLLQKHVGLILQFVEASSKINTSSSQKNSNKNTNFMEFSKSVVEIKLDDIDYDKLSESCRTMLEQVDNDLYEILVFTLSLLHITALKHDLLGMLTDICARRFPPSKSSATYTITSSTTSDIANLTNELHKLRCLPGLYDLLNLLFTIITVISKGGASTMESDLSPARLLSTSRCMSIFLQWLESNKLYWVFISFQRPAWEEIESRIAWYVQSFPRLTAADADITSMRLHEDIDLLGFTPMLKSAMFTSAPTSTSTSSTQSVDTNSPRTALSRCSVLSRLHRCLHSIGRLSEEFLCLKGSNEDNVTSIYFDAEMRPLNVNGNLSQRRRLFVLSDRKYNKEVSDMEEKQLTQEDDNGDMSTLIEAMVSVVVSEELAESPVSWDPLKEKAGLLRVTAPPKKTSKVQASGKNKQKGKSGPKYEVKSLPLIVVDAANVAMKHGLRNKFSCQGIAQVIRFFQTAGHKVVGFLPDYYLNFERIGELRRLGKLNLGTVRAAQIPDDVQLLQDLVSSGMVISTPPQDYDDSYCITYARQHDGYVVTNDLYRDHTVRIENKEMRENTKKWIQSHSISFTFVGDEFLPNPDCGFFSQR